MVSGDLTYERSEFADIPFRTDPAWVVVYAEIDAERWKHRKIRVYWDGRIEYADQHGGRGSARLADQRIPTNEELLLRGRLAPTRITAEEFEVIWQAATADPPYLPQFILERDVMQPPRAQSD